MSRLWYGGDYNPEQWPTEVHEDDVRLMRRAGVTAVTVGVFSWSWLEPAPGRYEFGWLDTVLDRLGGGGIGVVLATPTASPPPWFSIAHPQALPVRPDGTRLTHGSRDTYCANAPAYLAACRNIATALGERYGSHPALKLWHVHNEYGTGCHCEVTAEAFRRWVEARYRSLEALNDAWTTAFWSQRYTEWAQIMPPRATQYLSNPAHALDFRRFTSDALLAAYVEQRDILRAASPGVPVTTNFVLGGWVPVDHADWAREVDLVAVDHYPTDAGLEAEEESAFAADLARGWAQGSSGGPAWLLMETAPSVINTPGRMHAKEPGRMARQSIAAVARGSVGAMFFQWRASRGGAELFHSALVPHAGANTRVYREAVDLGQQFDRMAEVADSSVRARVAIVYDEPSAWALQASVLPADDLDHLAEARRAHRALWQRGITADVNGGLDDIDRYAVLVLAAHYLMSDRQATALRRWVTAGGQLVAGYLSGTADEYGRVRTGGYCGALRDLLGVWVEEFHPLAAGVRVALSTGHHATSWTEAVHSPAAQVMIQYADGVLADRPAVTRHRTGAGVSWYLSTRLEPAHLADLLATVAADAGVGPVIAGLPIGVEAVRREQADQTWLFLLNHTAATQEVPARGLELLTGAPLTGLVRVPAGGTAVVRCAAADG